MSDFALRQFERLHAITGETPWCFPGSRYDPAIEKTNLPLDTKTVTYRRKQDEVHLPARDLGRPHARCVAAVG